MKIEYKDEPELKVNIEKGVSQGGASASTGAMNRREADLLAAVTKMSMQMMAMEKKMDKLTKTSETEPSGIRRPRSEEQTKMDDT